MQIFLKVIRTEEGVNEWAMIELQGELMSKEEDSLSGKFVGDLYYQKDGTPLFIIGHHILFGKTQKLDKPLGVLEKVRLCATDGSESTEYKLKAMIKRKIVFRERPKPIVAAERTSNPKLGARKSE